MTVVRHAATIAAGEWITASGEWINDRTHGQQFKARFLRTSPPSSADGIEKYLSSGMIRGIGPAYAKKLLRALGENVFDIIEATPGRLRELRRHRSGTSQPHHHCLGPSRRRCGNCMVFCAQPWRRKCPSRRLRADPNDNFVGQIFDEGAQARGHVARALGVIEAISGIRGASNLLAKAAGLSRSGLAAQFRTSVGEPPHSYLIRWRMGIAAQLLEHTGLRLAEIAARVGYKSEFAFSRAFARARRLSPARFRNRVNSTG